MTELVSSCERAVAQALRMGAGAAEAFALRERSASVEIEKGAVSAAAWEETGGLGLRVVADGRVGFAYATQEDRVPEAIQAALRASRLGRRLPAFRFPGPGPAPRVAGLRDARLVDLPSERLLEAAGEILDAAAGVRKDLLVAGGGVAAGETESALANSEGLTRSHRDTSVGGHGYVVQRRDGVSTGFASRQSTRLDIDFSKLGQEAGALCVASAKPRPLPRGGVLPCVVRPDAAADLLSTITVPSLYGKPAHRGESYYSGKVGRAVMHPKLSLTDDATQPRGLGSAPFDDEGTPARPRPIVARGVLRTFLYDRHDAAEYRRRSTGNAVRSHAFDGRSFKSAPSTAAWQLRVAAPATTTQKLVASVDDGLLLHDLMGVHTANTASGDFSVTSSVLFRIRKGEVEGSVAPLSVAGNLHAALRAGIRMGDDDKPIGGLPAWNLPSLLFDGFTATP